MPDLTELITASRPVMQQHQANLDAANNSDAADEATKASEYRAKFPGAPPPTEADYGAMAKDGYDLGPAPYNIPDMYKRPQPVPAQDIVDRERMREESDQLDLPPAHDVGAWDYTTNIAGAVGTGVRNAAQEF